MKTLLIRSASGFVYAALVLLSIYWGPMVFGLVMLLFAFFAIQEIQELAPLKPSKSSKLFIGIIGIFLYLLFYIQSLNYLPIEFLSIGIGLLFIVFMSEVFIFKGKAYESSATKMLSLIYTIIPLGLINYLFYFGNQDGTPDKSLLFAFFIFIWLNDTFAYLTGSLIGKHKLAEKISPKKTIEGSLGGMLFTLGASVLFSLYFPIISLYEWLIFAFIIVIMGTIGDLFESILKRSAGVKDSGNIMPGHGGILDRLDSVLLAAPFIFIYLKLIR